MPICWDWCSVMVSFSLVVVLRHRRWHLSVSSTFLRALADGVAALHRIDVPLPLERDLMENVFHSIVLGGTLRADIEVLCSIIDHCVLFCVLLTHWWWWWWWCRGRSGQRLETSERHDTPAGCKVNERLGSIHLLHRERTDELSMVRGRIVRGRRWGGIRRQLECFDILQRSA